jgi:hypothetical protein
MALLMVVVLGFAAIAIDVSAMYTQRQQLQTGADAGALAIAQDCSAGSCGSPADTARILAGANLNSGTSTVTAIVDETAQGVTVTNSGVRDHLFAPVLGIDSSDLSTSATVEWGTATGGIGQLPLTFQLCEFNAQTAGGVPSDTVERTINFSKTSDTAANCKPPSGNIVPGGFGWVEVNSGTCNRASAVAGVLSQLESDPGNSPPSTCSPADFAKVQDATILLPLFDEFDGNGSNAWYKVYGYAAFKVTGYYFASHFNWNSPCGGSERCIRGYFTKMTDRAEGFTYGTGAPQLGASAIFLTE